MKLTNLALTLVAAGCLSASAFAATYNVSLFQNSVVDGKQIKAGDYKLELKDNNTAILKHGKQTVELPVRQETSPNRYSTTEVQFNNSNNLQEIHIGGTHTRLVFAPANGSAAGGM